MTLVTLLVLSLLQVADAHPKPYPHRHYPAPPPPRRPPPPVVIVRPSTVALPPVATPIAGVYPAALEDRITVSGDRYKTCHRTAAHPDLPFGTKVRVTRVASGKQVKVVINDRPLPEFQDTLTLSERAGRRLGMYEGMHEAVTFEIIGCKDKYGECED